MPPIGLTHYLVFSAILFCMGLFAVMVRRHAVAVLLGIELMLNAANINLAAMSRYLGPSGGREAGAERGPRRAGLRTDRHHPGGLRGRRGPGYHLGAVPRPGHVNPDEAADMKW